MSLETLLRDAAPEARFDPADVRQRVDRVRRRRRRALGVAAALVVLAGGAAGLGLASRDTTEAPTSTHEVPITEEALVGSPWVALTATSSYFVPTIDFDADGDVRSHFECTGVGGRWAVADGELRIRPGTMALDRCATKQAVLGEATLHDDGTLQFTGGGAVVDFRRLDDLGRRATGDDLIGTWAAPRAAGSEGAGGPVTFGPNTLESTNGCEALWTLRDQRLHVVERPGCRPFAPRQAHLEHGVVGTSSPWLVDGALVLVQEHVTTRLLPVEGLVGMWIVTDVAGEDLDAARLTLTAAGTYSLDGPCTVQTGTWVPDGGSIRLEVTSDVDPFCEARPADAQLDAVGGLGEVVDGTLVFGDTVLRPVDDLDPVAEDDLVGRWAAGNWEVEFLDDSRLVLGATCASVLWSLDDSVLTLDEDPSSCSLGDPPILGEVFPVGETVALGLDGDALYVGEAAPFVLHRVPDDAPPPELQPPPLHGVDDPAELLGTWRTEDGTDVRWDEGAIRFAECRFAWELEQRAVTTPGADCNPGPERELLVALIHGAFVRTDGERLVLYDGNQQVELTRVD